MASYSGCSRLLRMSVPTLRHVRKSSDAPIKRAKFFDEKGHFNAWDYLQADKSSKTFGQAPASEYQRISDAQKELLAQLENSRSDTKSPPCIYKLGLQFIFVVLGALVLGEKI